MSIEEGMSLAKFCFVPYGTMQGYGGRYLPAVLFGCVPVFWLIDQELHPTVKPFQELPDVDWDSCSLNTTADTIATLHETLDAITPTQVCTCSCPHPGFFVAPAHHSRMCELCVCVCLNVKYYYARVRQQRVQLSSMQACLKNLWPRMLFTTMRGSYIGEDGTRDAWNGMFEVLARRAERWTLPRTAAQVA